MSELSVPWLRSGTGSTPSDGGCIMQVIDWIDRNKWTDRPPCVHPVLAKLAIRANDSLDDKGRQKLLDLAPRLMGTASDDKMLSVKLAVFCARKVLHLFEAKYPKDFRPRQSIEAAEAWITEPSEENRAKAIEARKHAAYAAAATALPFLIEVLEEYERIVGSKDKACVIDYAPVVQAMASVA